MKQIYLITNDHKDPELRVTRRVQASLERHGMGCVAVTLSDLRKSTRENGKVRIPEDTAMALVLGGDGTMLEAVHYLPHDALPLLGINLGNIGYLTEVEESDIDDALEKVATDAYTTEQRMMIGGRVFPGEGNKTEAASFQALNDIVIARYGAIKMLRLHIDVNGSPLCDYHADGVILSTPTGSTGYNMSAGGPIVEPTAGMIVMTPIAPHSLSPRSIVLSADDVIRVTISSTHEREKSKAEISFDAAHTVKARPGDAVEITQADRQAHIVRLERASFLDVLHRKLV